MSWASPAFNEEGNIEQALSRAHDVTGSLFADYEVVVVDHGSSDRTAEIVHEAAFGDSRIRLISHGRNLGYGEALRTGLENSTKDLVFVVDADNQFDGGELISFLPWIEHVDVLDDTRPGGPAETRSLE